ncbi:NAD(P)H-dependent oxidoreductase [Dactylosporangium vinaceum]|uniref:NADPH-dependent FMN reductase n=1 Tax=Dactylosporangium vinaceum TaxID=53362 RepID=A0ABV5LYR2_9ACTN|nr:NAD(P)H-dependent oxidoreductase [Dactylosporangium vinaceum]UAB95268.1 NAD(P)H-dependent oxidoreductase [Dactylosporangium vinaceum]
MSTTEQSHEAQRPRLEVIVASTRPGRVGGLIADWFVAEARAHTGFDVHVSDLAEINLPLLDEPHHPALRNYTKPHTREWSATIDAADAVVFVTPEYNHSFTAPLKNAIDFLVHEWRDKPAAFVSYGGQSSGLRAVTALRPVVSMLGMMAINAQVAIPTRQHVTAERTFHSDPALDAAAKAVLDELARLSPAFKALRAAK